MPCELKKYDLYHHWIRKRQHTWLICVMFFSKSFVSLTDLKVSLFDNFPLANCLAAQASSDVIHCCCTIVKCSEPKLIQPKQSTICTKGTNGMLISMKKKGSEPLQIFWKPQTSSILNTLFSFLSTCLRSARPAPSTTARHHSVCWSTQPEMRFPVLRLKPAKQETKTLLKYLLNYIGHHEVS